MDNDQIEQIVEKIIFNKSELDQLKIAIKNFSIGKINSKELKQLLLQCRGRMVDEVTDFVLFIPGRFKNRQVEKSQEEKLNSSTKVESQLRKEIEEKNELLETVAERVNRLVSKLGSKEIPTKLSEPFPTKSSSQLFSNEFKEYRGN
jgi:hypothetical protein